MLELYNMTSEEFCEYTLGMSIWDKRLLGAKRVFELEVVNKGWVFGENYSYSRSKVKVPLTCEKGHSVLISPDSFKAGIGCATCAGRTSGGDSFIGTEHVTCFGNTLTVVGLNRISRTRARIYDINCSICSKDTELFPVGNIVSHKGNILRGSVPCGCGKTTQWSKEQYEVKIKRYCAENNLIFNGYIGEWVGNNTYLNLTCENGHIWDTCRIHRVLSQKPASCKYCVYDNRDWGYYRNKAKDIDYLYIMRFTLGEESFIKVGRSFNVHKRINALARSGYEVKLMVKFSGLHEYVYKQEQEIHKVLREDGFYFTPSIHFAGDSECFKIESTIKVIPINLKILPLR